MVVVYYALEVVYSLNTLNAFIKVVLAHGC